MKYYYLVAIALLLLLITPTSAYTLGIMRGDAFFIYNPDSTGVEDQLLDVFTYGQAGDYPIAFPDGRVGTFKQGVWSIRNATTGEVDETFIFGQAGDYPFILPNGRLGIFREGVWYLKEIGSSQPEMTWTFGAAGDVPIVLSGGRTAVLRWETLFIPTAQFSSTVDTISVIDGIGGKRPMALPNNDVAFFNNGIWYKYDGATVSHYTNFGMEGDSPFTGFGNFDRGITYLEVNAFKNPSFELVLSPDWTVTTIYDSGNGFYPLTRMPVTGADGSYALKTGTFGYGRSSVTQTGVDLSNAETISYDQRTYIVPGTGSGTFTTRIHINGNLIDTKAVSNTYDWFTQTIDIPSQYRLPNAEVTFDVQMGNLDGSAWLDNVYAKALVEELPPPSAGFVTAGGITEGDTPLVIEFIDQTTYNPTSWLWDFGDGTSSSEQNPTHTYTNDGYYTVSLTASNDKGQSTATYPDYIRAYGTTTQSITISAYDSETSQTLSQYNLKVTKAGSVIFNGVVSGNQQITTDVPTTLELEFSKSGYTPVSVSRIFTENLLTYNQAMTPIEEPPATLQIEVKDSLNNPVESVAVSIDDTAYTATTTSAGIVQFQLPATYSPVDVTISYVSPYTSDVYTNTKTQTLVSGSTANLYYIIPASYTTAPVESVIVIIESRDSTTNQLISGHDIIIYNNDYDTIHQATSINGLAEIELVNHPASCDIMHNNIHYEFVYIEAYITSQNRHFTLYMEEVVEPKGRIVIEVLGEGNLPIQDASVYIQGLGTKTTNVNGLSSFDLVPAGDYGVTVTYGGNTYNDDVSVTAPYTTYHTMFLPVVAEPVIDDNRIGVSVRGEGGQNVYPLHITIENYERTEVIFSGMINDDLMVDTDGVFPTNVYITINKAGYEVIEAYRTFTQNYRIWEVTLPSGMIIDPTPTPTLPKEKPHGILSSLTYFLGGEGIDTPVHNYILALIIIVLCAVIAGAMTSSGLSMALGGVLGIVLTSVAGFIPLWILFVILAIAGTYILIIRSTST